MYVTLSFADLLSFMEAVVAFMLGAMLLASGKVGVRWLAAFCFVLGVSFIQAVMPSFNLPVSFAPLVRWLYATQLLAMPFLYQYAVIATSHAGRLRFYHYVPAVFAAIALLPFLGSLLSGTFVVQLIVWLIVLQVVAYLTAIIFMVRAYRIGLKQTHSTLTGIGFRWLEHLCIWLMALIVFDITIFPLMAHWAVPFETIQFVFNLISTLYVLWLARSALEQHSVSSESTEKLSPSYEKSGLDSDTARSLAASVVKVMETEELYLKPDLMLADMASSSGVSNHILSEVLNKTIGQNFYDFVNSYRVKAAQELLGKTEHTVLDIAFSVGFNNKVSFNQAFKKQVSMTPSQYRQHLRV